MRPALRLTDRPLPLQQSEGFARALRCMGRAAELRGLHDAGQVLIVSRKFGRFGNLRFASRGPVFRDDAVFSDRVDALRGARLHIVNAGADQGNVLRASGFRQVMTSASVAILQINDDPEAQLARCHGKWRNAARQSARSGLRIRQRLFCPDRDGWLLAADTAQQKAKGFRALPHGLSTAYARANPADAIIATAQDGAATIAAMLFLRHGGAATYQIGWSGPQGRSLRAHHTMLLDAARRFAALGVTELDLGVVDTERAPGLARFKIGAGATVVELGGTWVRMPGWRG